jgi:integrase
MANDDSTSSGKRRRRPKGAGQLIHRRGGWYARVVATVDGERVRVMRELGTHSLPAARRKLERLVAEGVPATVDAGDVETFAQAVERTYTLRAATRAFWAKVARAWLRKYAVPVIGPMPVDKVGPADVSEVLRAAAARGQSKQSVQHGRKHIAAVFRQLRIEGVLAANPTDGAFMPDVATAVRRERAVLTDAELAVYLAWEPEPEPGQKRVGRGLELKREHALELQTMACVSRMFGGVRTGDLLALCWEAFDVEQGAFTWGYAPRQKTRRPQLLEVPEMLRPFLRDHWERSGRPQVGLVFPVRRKGRLGSRVGLQRRHVSFAEPFRRDLQRAFKAAAERNVEAPREGSRRWRELFDDGEPFTRPVDFHSWRRAYVQALADADVNAQQAAALAGHADLGAHARYLANAGKLRKLPEAALPDLRVSTAAIEIGNTGGTQLSKSASTALDKAARQGSVRASERVHALTAPAARAKTPRKADRKRPGTPPEPKVAGSNPSSPATQGAETAGESGSAEAPAAAAEPSQGSAAALSTDGHAVPEGMGNTGVTQLAERQDPVEAALAAALKGATEAGEWSVVAQLARELEARRQARAGVVDLEHARARRGTRT